MQIGILNFIKGFLLPSIVFPIGIIIIVILLILVFKKNQGVSKFRISSFTLLMYYYIHLMLVNIVGIPTITELNRIAGLGEPFFNPKLNLIPMVDGFSLSFILNIFLFMPFGFLCPMISVNYKKARNTLLLGLGLSLAIEVSQLFTLHRASDIDDLLTNILGTVIGYLCFRLFVKMKFIKSNYGMQGNGKDLSQHLPLIITVIAFVVGFCG